MAMNDAHTPAGSQMAETLAQLKDIHLPDPIGWWPMAFSWWVLLFSLSALLFALVWFLLDRHKRQAYRREALQRFNELQNNREFTPQQQILQINALLKQVAITAYGRKNVASLNEQAWLKFLYDTAKYIPQPDNLAHILATGYQATDKYDPRQVEQQLELWRGYAKQWIKGHHL